MVLIVNMFYSSIVFIALSALTAGGQTSDEALSSEKPTIILSQHDKMVCALDSNGSFLWKDRFQVPLIVPSWDESPPFALDLDHNGIYEFLLTTRFYDILHKGRVFCFNSDGKLRWRYNIESDEFLIPYQRAGPKGNVGFYFPLIPRIDYYVIHDLDDDGIQEIVFSIRGCEGFDPSAVFILDIHGNNRGIFWNPGNLIEIRTIKKSLGRKPGLLVAGYNNHQTSLEQKSLGNYRHALFLLEGLPASTGVKPSSFKAPYKTDDPIPGWCNWYLLFPKVFLLPGSNVPINISIENEQGTTNELLFIVSIRESYRFVIDHDGRVLDLVFYDRFIDFLTNNHPAINQKEYRKQLISQCRLLGRHE